jgi:predicted glycogen debranching enzyme
MNLDAREWLETDGLGGFASGTVSGVRTRRYHGLLLTATTPPTGRLMLVNGFDASVETSDGVVPISTQRYSPDVLHPDGVWQLDRFSSEPWPTWRYRLSADAEVMQELFVPRGAPRVVVRWTLIGKSARAMLRVRPFLSGRDYHAMHHENGSFRFHATPSAAESIEWTPYDGVPGVRSLSNGSYVHAPEWYRNFLYLEERGRGLDDTEDLASPGELTFDLTAGEAVWILEPSTIPPTADSPVTLAAGYRRAEVERRQAYPSRLHRAADQYLARRADGCTVIAGYPWFTDWGRDTFIAMRGLCLAAGRIGTARRILLSWADVVSEGMLPNRFPDSPADAPEYNSVDASLWFIVAVRELLETADRSRVTAAQRRQLNCAVNRILRGYSMGTRYGIRADTDGLLAAGAPGVQLTWMDAKVGDDVVTPRIGKPVEVQALWLNALAFGADIDDQWRPLFDTATASFTEKFWNESRGCLYDVIDVDHAAGRVDDALRPNQIFAIGGLPYQALNGERARRVVDEVERALVTSTGLRSLAPGEPGYSPRYEGGVWQRDHAYHQGTVWPWLMGAFIEAWVRVRGSSREAHLEARRRFLRPMLAALDGAGLGHLPEITDAEAPFASRGCPFQAWSVGELLRVSSRNIPD